MDPMNNDGGSSARQPSAGSQWQQSIENWMAMNVPIADRAAYAPGPDESAYDSLFYFVGEFQILHNRLPVDKVELDVWINTEI